MYAVVRTGGKQYRVTKDDVIAVEKMAAEAGQAVSLDDVLMIAGEGSPVIGVPSVKGASVAAEVIEQARDDKIIVFKKKRRKNYRRKHGHRQHLTLLKIVDILPDGAAAKPKKAKAVAKADGGEKPQPAKKPAAERKADAAEDTAERKAAAKTTGKKTVAEKTAAKKPAAKTTDKE